jgi:uncharacterized surface protein with fasciclin (FAS1) repeats
MRKLTSLLIAAILIGIAAAAAIATAGGDEQTKPAEATPTQSQTIVEVAAGDKRFDTLVDLVESAGLAEALSAEGPFTVFAPTDKAFGKVPARTLRALGEDKAALRRVLLYHAVSGSYEAAELIRMRSVPSLAGPRLHVRKRGRTVRVEGAKVVQADVAAANGVIHAINRVLIPPKEK